MRRRQGRLLGLAVLAAALVAAPGCMRCLHPIPDDLWPKAEHCPSLPQACRNHVYIFLIHGVDPLDYANLAGVRDYLIALGFPKTWYGQMYHASHFAAEIRRIHKEDPLARFVVVGFSFGANLARNVAHAAAEDNISIDLLFYLGGNTLKDCPYDRPANACKVVNILARGCIWNGTHFDDALNIEYDDVYHFGSPTHRQTLAVLTEELTLVASRVPVVQRVPEAFPVPSPPRPEVPPVEDEAPGPEWDFLKDGQPAPAPTGERGPTQRPPQP
jgi:hypothetical protein